MELELTLDSATTTLMARVMQEARALLDSQAKEIASLKADLAEERAQPKMTFTTTSNAPCLLPHYPCYRPHGDTTLQPLRYEPYIVTCGSTSVGGGANTSYIPSVLENDPAQMLHGLGCLHTSFPVEDCRPS